MTRLQLSIARQARISRARPNVPVSVLFSGPVTVRVRVGFDRDRVELAVSHAFLCNHGFGESRHHVGLAAQNDRFDAMIVIQMRVRRRDSDVVMVIMQGSQTTRELPFMMVVGVSAWFCLPSPRRRCCIDWLTLTCQHSWCTRMRFVPITSRFGTSTTPIYSMSCPLAARISRRPRSFRRRHR
jgi:hypothetical protein